jgi:hypothetical protein|tara:strand:- start:247 stop:723 length:477 start_codon:yes stop_codon:yes gene_type:complete
MPGKLNRARIWTKTLDGTHYVNVVRSGRENAIEIRGVVAKAPPCGIADRIQFIDGFLAVLVAGGGGRHGFLAVVTMGNINSSVVKCLVAVVDVRKLVVVDDFVARVVRANNANIDACLVQYQPSSLVGVPVQGEIEIDAVLRFLVGKFFAGAVCIERL